MQLITNGDKDEKDGEEKGAAEREMETEEAKKIVESITDSITSGEKLESKSKLKKIKVNC